MRKLISLAAVCAIFAPALALGQNSVTVLGLRSATADEELAAQMTAALRQAADSATSSGLSHTGRENVLSQLLVVFDCPQPTNACMQQIGESLNSDRLVYGLIEPLSGRPRADYALSLKFFNVETGLVERDLREIVPRNITYREMIESADQFYTALTGRIVSGELALRCNVPGARVLIDNQAVGLTTAEPLVLRDLEPGEIEVTVLLDGYDEYHRTVSIEEGQLNELDVELNETGDSDGERVFGAGGENFEGSDWESGDTESPRGRRNLAWLGWTNLGVGAVFLGLGIWSSLSVQGDQSELDPERLTLWPDGVDMCEEASRGVTQPGGMEASEITAICEHAYKMEILQFVFYGLAAITGGIGLWLILREQLRNNESSERNAMRLRVDPVALRRGGAVTATLNF